jgi:hypothetical protein
VRRDVVPHERENQHDHVFGDADAVAVGHLGHRDAVLDRRLKIDMIGADPRRHGELELGRLGDPLRGQVRRPERLGDHDRGARELPLEDRIRPVLFRRDHQPMPALLHERPQPELTRHAPEQLTRREVGPLRSRRRLPVGIALDRRDAIARVGGRVSAHRVVVEHAENRCHRLLRFARLHGFDIFVATVRPRAGNHAAL